MVDLGALGAHRSRAALCGECLDADTGDEEQADGGALPGAGDADEDQRVVDELDEQHTEDRSAYRPASAEDRRASEDDGGDDVEFVADEFLGVGGPAEDHVDHAGGCGEGSGDDVHPDLGAFDVDAGSVGGFGVAADRVDCAPEHGPAEHQRDDDREDDGRDDHGVQQCDARRCFDGDQVRG